MSNKVLDLDGLEYYHSKNKELLDGKVDKVEGKTLSTNDFTDEYKEKLDSIASNTGGSGVQSDWTTTDETSLAFIKNKPTIPTKTSELTNDSGFVTTNTTYEAAGEDLGLVKSGGDVTITDGIITVNDDGHNHVIDNVDGLQSVLDTKVSTTTKVNGKELSSDITISASDVGADVSGSASSALTEAKGYTDTALETAKSYTDTTSTTTLDSAKSYADTVSAEVLDEAKEYNDNAYANANLYTDQKIADLINGAPTTMDTLKEISDAMAENKEVVEALDEAIGSKADQAELDTHTGNSTIHVTSTDKSNWNDANSKKHTHSNKTVLDGITAIDTALSDSSTNPVQNKTIKQAFDAIQTTSKGTLKTAGWYRVAEYVSTTTSMKGTQANACTLVIKKGSTATRACHYEIALESSNSKQKFVVKESYINNHHSFTKIRYVYEGTSAFLEVYYDENGSNNCSFTVSNGNDYHFNWKAITPTLTQETVSGVTVTTTYDIPANASPVTDLDLQRLDGTGAVLATSILEKAKEVGVGVHVYRLAGVSYTGGDIPNGAYYYSVAKIDKRANDEVVVTLSGIFSANSKLSPPIFNMYNGTAWSGWNTTATTADLAKYLPLTGGTITANSYAGFRVKRNSTDTAHFASVMFANNNGDLGGIASDGDGTLIAMTKGGASKGTILHTGNMANHVLPLTGGEVNGDIIIKTAGAYPRKFAVENSKRRLTFEVDSGGNGYIWDGTHGKSIANMSADGTTNTWNGTASGNIARDGGGTITSPNTTFFALNSTGGDLVAQRFGGTSGILGHLGFNGVNKPVYGNANGTFYSLHHDGNSAKVHIGTSAPTDTTSLWYDTTNKIVKAYINGAWTATTTTIPGLTASVTELNYMDGVTSNVQTQLNGRVVSVPNSAATPSQDAQSYFKICTIQLPNQYADLYLEFDLSGRTTTRFQKVKCAVCKSNSTAISDVALYTSGNNGNKYGVHAYKYTDTTKGDYLEIWCTITSWDNMFVRLNQLTGNFSNFPSYVTWNYTRATALPTTSTTVVKVDATNEKWSGEAASATTATTATKLGTATKGSATQPIYLNAGTPTACTYTLGKSVPSDALFMSSSDKLKLDSLLNDNILVSSLAEKSIKSGAITSNLSDYGKSLLASESRQLTITFEAKSDVETNIDCYPRDSSGNAKTGYAKVVSVGTEWNVYSVIMTLPAGEYSAFTVRSNTGVSGGSSTASVNIRNVTVTVNGTASRLGNTSAIGSTTKPVYFNASGVPVATNCELKANILTSTGSLASGGWKTLGGTTSGSKITTYYSSSTPATWNSAAYSAGLVFGCNDTKGMLDIAHANPVVAFGGGSTGGSTDDAPAWHFKLGGTNGKSYTLPSDSCTLASSTHTHSAATTSASGFMTSAMVTKLNGIATGANKYTHPTTSGNKHIPSGGSSGQILRWSADGTAVWGVDVVFSTIDSNTDLNSIITPGNYSASATATSQSLLNNPLSTVATGIYLNVYQVGTIICQFLVGTISGGIYKRRYNPSSSDWSSWIQMATTSDNVASATKASKLSNTTAIGSTTNPVYFDANGKPVATTYTLGKSVPSNAVFTDTKVTISANAPTAKTDYYPVMHTSTSGTTAVTANANIRLQNLTGTASTEGYNELILGNATATGTAGNSHGRLTLFSQGTSYHYIKPTSTNTAITHTLPATSGTFLNTGTTSVTQTLTSGTEIGTVKINGTSTKLYAPTNTDTQVKQTQSTTSSYRALLMGTSYNSDASQLGTEETGQVYKHTSIVACPSTGEIKATKFTGALNGNASTATTLSGLTATVTELNYVDGVTSNIQTQINGKAASSHTHNYAGSSSAGGAATYANYLNVMHSNEIRLGNKPSSVTDIHIGYKWADGTSASLINGYVFEDGSGTRTKVYASSFYEGTTALADKYQAKGNYAAASHGTHVTYGTSASALGTSSAGTATTVSRSDHVHALPALTSCTGTLTVAKGGTGATDAATARTNLGVAYGTTAGTVCQGNDSRLSDSRTPKSHNQAASTITAGTFAGAVVAPASTAYTTNQIRNTVFTTTDPGAGVTTSYANGSIICVYE